MNHKLMNPIEMFVVGLGLGIVSRLLDIYAQNLGEIFSQMAIWTLFALCSPILAVLAWKSKEEGVFPGVIRIGIVAVSVLSSILLFDRLRIYDLVIDGMLIYSLFFKKVQRH